MTDADRLEAQAAALQEVVERPDTDLVEIDILRKLEAGATWTPDEASRTGRLIPQRVLDQWNEVKKEAYNEIIRLRSLLARPATGEAS